MNEINTIERIKELGIVAVIRAESSEQALKIAQACMEGGIFALEVTFTVPDAHLVIKELTEKLKNTEALIGAGTVLDEKTVNLAVNSGAKFVVSPGYDEESRIKCQELNIPYIPGCMTITEMMNATKKGIEVVKLFPGSVFGPTFIKSVKGPLPNINIMPTGGVDLDNIDQWIKNGAVSVGIGSQLTNPAKTNNYQEITTLAKKFVKKLNDTRKELKL